MYNELQDEGYTEVNIMGINGFQYLDNDYHCMICDTPDECSSCNEERVLPWVQDLDDDDNEVDYQITQKLLRYEVDLIVLAGYMKRLGELIMSTFKDRIVNVHPSLLPKFGGKGMYGIKVHESALEAGEHKTGETIHKVQGEYDRGTILAQAEVQIRENDTPSSLRDRVLIVEHELYVETLREISLGGIKL